VTLSAAARGFGQGRELASVLSLRGHILRAVNEALGPPALGLRGTMSQFQGPSWDSLDENVDAQS